MRLVLAATLSSVYGIYNGSSLIENRHAASGCHRVHLDSEMYRTRLGLGSTGQHRRRCDPDQSRAAGEPALQRYDNLRFHPVDNDQLLVYSSNA